MSLINNRAFSFDAYNVNQKYITFQCKNTIFKWCFVSIIIVHNACHDADSVAHFVAAIVHVDNHESHS